ncbi:gliding motility lipoprotein GldB [Belliella kenyensis]|uniref:Gliding motility lipoprotein GldB n=1 Tax=Belliella kenyensis TaxID=1472724 RepID=A0ABV8EQ80_9BACT|nr:gliding motility lipoprotein GldB [Belliella kenyensis]MCH7401555.1 gliding motility lipoprotein GldB [Belliella kenyensis]MDN3603165.1 gliding motility lipoprotein GldB [Belliella kenyensis]
MSICLKKTSYIFLLLSIFGACKSKDESCQIDDSILNAVEEIHIQRLEKVFYESSDVSDMNYLLEEYPVFAEKFLQLDDFESKEALAEDLWLTNQDSLMQELYAEVKNEFQSVATLEKDLRQAFAHIKHYYPDFKIPKVYTFLTGFNIDLFISEDMIVIGLDYFLPKTHKFQPPDLPQYMADRYESKYIVPMIVTAISSRYNAVDLSQNTLIADMIFYGKAYHFVKSMMPCTSDEYIIGYSTEEIEACYANEEFIWTHFIENDLLYSNNPFVIRKYTGESPATDEISPDAPGRVGRWLGWNIVDDFRFNNSMSLEELMKESNADRIFRQSGYKPRR